MKDKELIHSYLTQLLEEKMLLTKGAINDLIESRNKETKSSAGDKHETARAMAQIELDNYQNQFEKLKNQHLELSKINIENKYQKVVKGALVTTNNGTYFISIGIGKVEIKDKIIYSISLLSPVGMALHNKTIGDVITFQNNKIEIKEIT